MNWIRIAAEFLFKIFVPMVAFFAGKNNKDGDDAAKDLGNIRDVQKTHDTIERVPSERDRVHDKYK